jgi:hypothetical protein
MGSIPLLLMVVVTLLPPPCAAATDARSSSSAPARMHKALKGSLISYAFEIITVTAPVKVGRERQARYAVSFHNTHDEGENQPGQR